MTYEQLKEEVLENLEVDEWLVFEEIIDLEDKHSSIATLKNNLAISLRYGISHNDNFVEKWANSFPDEHAKSFYIELFYNENVVYRNVVVSVDGGRGLILLPSYDMDMNYKIRGLKYTKEDYKLARLIENLFSVKNVKVDDVIEMNGIKIV